MKWLVVAVAITVVGGAGAGGGCGGGGGGKAKPTSIATPDVKAPATAGDRLLALLPHGAQLVIEIDLARLRANPVVGPTIAKLVTGGTITTFPGDVPASPLAVADAVVLAAYGVGTSHAATVTMVASSHVVPDAVRVTEGVYAYGPSEWVGQLEQRAVLTLGDTVIAPPAELLALRDRSMPAAAPGAALRITARLPFDARVALARETGLESAPAQLSVWADVVDDFVIIIDADASDPGDRAVKRANARLEAMLRAALVALAEEPAVRALGLPASLTRAKLATRGTWIRTIVAIGPAKLRRVVERANVMLEAAVKAPSS